jgi:oligoribonuclease NrnB/cAMP/cGMP phosphodiesterase (DHH superfamily)
MTKQTKKLLPPSYNIMNPKNIDVIIYHSPCPDGIAAAWVAHKYAKQNKLNYTFQGISTNSSQEFTPELTEIIKGKNILFVDYAPTDGQYKIATELASSIIILDHHITNKEKYETNPNAIFDMNLSGVGLAWEYFYPNEKLPVYLKMIQERDLWKWKTDKAQEFTNGLHYCGSNKLIPYCELMYEIEKNSSKMNEVITVGTTIEKNKQNKINYITKNLTKVYNYDNFKVCIINCSEIELVSDLGNAIMKTGLCDFVVLWRYNHEEDKYSISLRSCDSSPADVSKIAKELGGGGHRNASGCCIKENPVIFFNDEYF